MLKKKCLNKKIMTEIRYTILLSTFVVCMMDTTVENALNLMYIFANDLVLNLIRE